MTLVAIKGQVLTRILLGGHIVSSGETDRKIQMRRNARYKQETNPSQFHAAKKNQS